MDISAFNKCMEEASALAPKDTVKAYHIMITGLKKYYDYADYCNNFIGGAIMVYLVEELERNAKSTST